MHVHIDLDVPNCNCHYQFVCNWNGKNWHCSHRFVEAKINCVQKLLVAMSITQGVKRVLVRYLHWIFIGVQGRNTCKSGKKCGLNQFQRFFFVLNESFDSNEITKPLSIPNITDRVLFTFMRFNCKLWQRLKHRSGEFRWKCMEWHCTI